MSRLYATISRYFVITRKDNFKVKASQNAYAVPIVHKLCVFQSQPSASGAFHILKLYFSAVTEYIVFVLLIYSHPLRPVVKATGIEIDYFTIPVQFVLLGNIGTSLAQIDLRFKHSAAKVYGSNLVIRHMIHCFAYHTADAAAVSIEDISVIACATEPDINAIAVLSCRAVGIPKRTAVHIEGTVK